MKRFLLMIFFVVSSFFISAEEQVYDEGIKAYIVDVQINKNQTLSITETLDYYTNSTDKHGIFRDMPTTDIKSFLGINRILLRNVDITRNGLPEPYRIQSFPEGIRYRIGSADTYIDANNRYVIKYVVNNAIKEKDKVYQIYWNAIGQSWNFPIGSAVINIHYENNAMISNDEMQKLEVYTGSFGEKGTDYSIVNEGKNIKIMSKKAFNANEGLTFMLNMKTNQINPTILDKITNYYLVYKNLFIGMMLFIGSLIYALFSWAFFGKDPARKSIIPRFEVPKDISAMLVSYIKGERDPKVILNIGILSLVSKGYINILKEENKENKIKYELSESKEQLFTVEKELLNALIKSPNDILGNEEEIYKVSTKIIGLLETEYDSVIYKKNTALATPIILAIILFLFMVALPIILSGGSEYFVIVIFAFIFFLNMGISGSKLLKSLMYLLIVGAIALVVLQANFSPFTEILLVMILLGSLLMWYLKVIGKPTDKGNTVIEYIDGMKMYIETAEKNQIMKFNEPSELVRYFKLILPFAVALSVKNECVKLMESQIKMNGYDPTILTGQRSGIMYGNPLSEMYYRSAIFNSVNRSYDKGYNKVLEEKFHNVGGGSNSGGFGSGGFSGGGGGGFSGGGFGGGGGGSW